MLTSTSGWPQSMGSKGQCQMMLADPGSQLPDVCYTHQTPVHGILLMLPASQNPFRCYSKFCLSP